MANSAVDQALENLESATEAVRQAVTEMPAVADAAGAAAHGASGGAIDPFIFRFAIFVLAIFVGYYVVWSVTPALHTPLMSGHQCDFLGDRCWCAACRRDLGERACDRLRFHCAGVGISQYFRRLPGHPAHAGHVQEKRKVRG